MKMRVVHVEDASQLRRHLRFGAQIVNENAGVDEIGLPLEFAASQIGQQAAGRCQQHSGVGQRNTLAVPKAKRSAREFLMVLDRVESSGGAVKRLLVTRRPEKRTLETQPIAIER